MSKYNNISRSRSRERYNDDYYEQNKFSDNKNEKDKKEYRIKDLDIDRRLENLKNEKIKREKEREIERQNFLRRENDLLREINILKHQNNLYDQETPKSNYYQRYQNQKYSPPYNPRQSRFSAYNRNTHFNINQEEKYQSSISYNQKQNFVNKRENILNVDKNKYENPSSELDKLMSSLDEGNKKERQKFKNKIYLPKKPGVNFVGLLIGPKGIFLKLLEKQSDCKIYVNGSTIGKRERYINPDDNDKNHVLIIADSEEKMKRGTKLVEDILYADEDTRNKIISEQLKASKQGGFESLNFGFKKDEIKSDDYLMTPHGPPGKNARFYKIPNDCVDSIIGNKGETIKNIEKETNCKVQIAKAPIPNTKLRYIFIEGSEENYEIAKELIEKIIGDYVNMNIN